jgi:hypothetical protein
MGDLAPCSADAFGVSGLVTTSLGVAVWPAHITFGANMLERLCSALSEEPS